MKKGNNSGGNSADKKINIEEFKKAAQNGKAEDFINKNLSKETSEKLKRILNDKNATEKLLQTPQAKELMNKLLKK